MHFCLRLVRDDRTQPGSRVSEGFAQSPGAKSVRDWRWTSVMRKIRSKRLLLRAVILNILVAVIASSGVLLFVARPCASLLTILFGGSQLRRYSGGGFPNDDGTIAFIILPFHLLAQYTLARLAARTVVGRNRSVSHLLVATIWNRSLLAGLAPLVYVFFYDTCTLLTPAGNAEVTALPWLAYCFVSSLWYARQSLRRRSATILGLSNVCRYPMRATGTGRCPECGTARSREPDHAAGKLTK